MTGKEQKLGRKAGDEHLDRMKKALLKLQETPPDPQALQQAQRWALLATAEFLHEVASLLDAIDSKQGQILDILRSDKKR